jgi:hypothetical protein
VMMMMMMMMMMMVMKIGAVVIGLLGVWVIG